MTEIPSYFNVEFPLEYPLIAGLYSDVDARPSDGNSRGGAVWFRSVVPGQQTAANPSDAAVLARAADDVQSKFGARGFQPTEVFVVTWDHVGYFERRDDKVS